MSHITAEEKQARREKIATYSEWGYRVALALGVCALLFLNSNYVKQDKYAADQQKNDEKYTADQKRYTEDQKELYKTIDRIETLISVMQEANKANERQQKQLDDHESRLRLLERERLP